MNRTVVWHLAWRYLRGRRSANIVPILSRISILAIAVASCAMIVLFSVMNGFEYLIQDLYKAFYPEIKITAAKGKFFELNPQQMQSITAVKGITAVSRSIEDNVLLTANDETRVATVKGIDRDFFRVNNVRPYIIDGRDSVTAYPLPTAIVGLQVANEMGLDINNAFNIVSLFYPNPESSNLSLDPQSALQSLQLKPDGIFRVQDEFDSKYILAPLSLVQSLLKADNKFSSIEIAIDKGSRLNTVKKQLEQKLGKDFVVATRFEQNRTLYMVMRTEKWAIYAILLLVLLIASFNMVGALSLLVLEKQKDMTMLKAMGAEPNTIKNIFLTEGVLWALSGGLTGIVFGALLCLGQAQFGWIRMKGAFIIDSYPVAMSISDFLLVIFTVMMVGFLAALIPANKAKKAQVQLRTN